MSTKWKKIVKVFGRPKEIVILLALGHFFHDLDIFESGSVRHATKIVQ